MRPGKFRRLVDRARNRILSTSIRASVEIGMAVAVELVLYSPHVVVVVVMVQLDYEVWIPVDGADVAVDGAGDEIIVVVMVSRYILHRAGVKCPNNVVSRVVVWSLVVMTAMHYRLVDYYC